MNAALKQVNAAASRQGVTLSSAPIDTASPPGFDSGSVFARSNYRNYRVVTRSYEAYIREVVATYRALEQDNLRVYAQKVAEETATNARNVAALDRLPAGEKTEIEKLKEHIRHVTTLNQSGDTYYTLWVNLYVPMYTQKVKPGLEAYWNVSALYVRNMTAVEVIEREYDRIKSFYLDNAMQFAASAGTGGAFAYAGSTEQEEEALARAIEAAEAKAVTETVVYLRDHKVHKIPTMAENPGPDDWVFWTGQKFDYGVNGQFLSLHVTSRNIEFSAWAMGPAAGMNVQFEDGRVTKLDTYWAIQAKFKVGVQVGGVDLTAGGGAEFARQTSSWDFENGTYVEGFPTPSGSVSLKAKAGSFDASGSVKYDLSKGVTGASANANAGFGPMTAAGEIAYKVGKGVSGSGSVTSSAGPIAAALTTEFDSQLRFQRSGNVTAAGKTVMTQDFSIGPP